MSKFKGTYALAALVLVLVAYTAWEFKTANNDLDASKDERLAFSIRREDVREFSLIRPDETIQIKKEGDVWKMLKPVEDLADLSAVEGYLFSIVAQRLRPFQSADEAKSLKWADYGLETPRAKVELNSSQRQESITVSTKNAFDGSFYVRLKDEVFLGDRALAGLVDRASTSFRSHKIWREEDVEITKIAVENSELKEKFSFVKSDKSWVMQPPPKFAVDTHRLEVWVDKLQDFTPTDIMREGLLEKDKAEFLLVRPSAILTLDFKRKNGSTGQWILTLGQDKGDEVYLYTDQRATAYKASRSLVDPLRVGSAYFRDGHTPFQFNVELAREVRLNAEKLKQVFKKGDAGWVLADGSQNLELDQEKLVQLFTNLRSLEAEEFVDNGKGIKAPQVEVRDAKGQILFSLAWGDEYKGKSGWVRGAPLRYVKTNLVQGTIGVLKASLDKIINPAIVKAKAAAKPASTATEHK